MFKFSNSITLFFHSAGFFNLIYDNFFCFIFKSSNNWFTKVLDKGFFEYLGPQFLFENFKHYSYVFKWWYFPTLVLYSIFYIFIFFSIYVFIFYWYFLLIKYLLFQFSLFVIFLIIFFFESNVIEE